MVGHHQHRRIDRALGDHRLVPPLVHAKHGPHLCRGDGDEPATDATGLVSAAGHYAATCATCHGAPGERPSPVMQSATPNAPDLSVTAKTWSDEQLFWIIKHGVKFTPMPAWPALDRDDEVRRMAAFVRRLPAMTPENYRSLAYGSGRSRWRRAKRLEDALPDCERCHADDGRDQPDIPVLAGQKPAYLFAALDAYASGRRSSGVMSAAAARIDPAVRRALANHYAALPGLSENRMTAVAANLTSGQSVGGTHRRERPAGNQFTRMLEVPCTRQAARLSGAGGPEAAISRRATAAMARRREHHRRPEAQ